MESVKSVWYNDGNGDRFALVVKDHGDGKLDLIVFGEGTPEHEDGVPKGEGGRTWHP